MTDPDRAVTDQEAGYVEYGVRCPDGTARWHYPVREYAERIVGDLSHALSGHETGDGQCLGPHEVVQRTVGPWEVSR